MPASPQFLANILPYANMFGPNGAVNVAPGGAMPAADPTAAAYAGIPMGGGAPAPPAQSRVGALDPSQAAAFAGMPVPAPAQAPLPATPAPPPPQMAPPVQASGPDVPAAPPRPELQQPKLVALRRGGAPAREVDMAGERQKGLIGGALARRVEGIDTAEREQIQAQQEIVQSAQRGYANAEAERAGAQAAMANEQQQLDQKRQDIQSAVAKREATPITSYWADKSAAQSVGMALAAALGSFGSAFARGGNGGNPAMQLLQADIQRDLNTKEMRYRQQSAEGNARVDAAQADFNNMARQFGIHGARDIEAAAHQRMLASQAQTLAAKTAIPEIRAKAAQMVAELQAKANEYEATAMVKYIPPTAGSTSYIDPNLGIEMNRKEALNWAQEGVKSERELAGKSALESQKQQGDLAVAQTKFGNKQLRQDTKFIAEKMQGAKIPQYREAIDAASKLQQTVGDKGTSFASRGIWSASPLAYGKLFGEEAAAREQAFQTLANVKIKEEAGGNVTQGEWDRQVAALYGSRTDKARQNAITSLNKMLKSQEKNIFAGAGPAATEAYRSNRAALDAEDAVDFQPSEE